MRTAVDNERIWQGLADGTIQVMATDHCPFFFDGSKPIIYEGQPVAIPGKELGASDFTKIPNGLPGVGDRLPVLWTYGVGTGRISANQFVALTSTNPAKIFGLYPRKGSLLPGADADIVLWDPDRVLTYGVAHAHHRTDYNLFEGYELTGFPEKVFLRGQMIVDGDHWLGRGGMGRFLYRMPGAEVLWRVMNRPFLLLALTTVIMLASGCSRSQAAPSIPSPHFNTGTWQKFAARPSRSTIWLLRFNQVDQHTGQTKQLSHQDTNNRRLNQILRPTANSIH
jgi:hypothetical protein